MQIIVQPQDQSPQLPHITKDMINANDIISALQKSSIDRQIIQSLTDAINSRAEGGGSKRVLDSNEWQNIRGTYSDSTNQVIDQLHLQSKPTITPPSTQTSIPHQKEEHKPPILQKVLTPDTKTEAPPTDTNKPKAFPIKDNKKRHYSVFKIVIGLTIAMFLIFMIRRYFEGHAVEANKDKATSYSAQKLSATPSSNDAPKDSSQTQFSVFLVHAKRSLSAEDKIMIQNISTLVKTEVSLAEIQESFTIRQPHAQYIVKVTVDGKDYTTISEGGDIFVNDNDVILESA